MRFAYVNDRLAMVEFYIHLNRLVPSPNRQFLFDLLTDWWECGVVSVPREERYGNMFIKITLLLGRRGRGGVGLHTVNENLYLL